MCTKNIVFVEYVDDPLKITAKFIVVHNSSKIMENQPNADFPISYQLKLHEEFQSTFFRNPRESNFFY